MVDFKLNNLCFTFPNGKTVLKNISLEIKRGEFVVLCGKSFAFPAELGGKNRLYHAEYRASGGYAYG